MQEELWGAFVTYVNAYYAVQEAYDSAHREWERPAQGLKEFCRDANPFLWDNESSAEPHIYEGFLHAFNERFPKQECTPSEGRELVEEWLASLEGGEYGTSLVSSLQQVSNKDDWRRAYEPIARQLAARAVRLERTPQDTPHNSAMEYVAMASAAPQPIAAAEPAPANKASARPSQADIEAVIALLSKGDKEFAQSLRDRLAQEDAS